MDQTRALGRDRHQQALRPATVAQQTVAQILQDFRAGSLGAPTHHPDDIPDLVPHHISTAGWRRIDEHERALGRANRRPRVKIVDVDDMLDVALQRA